MKNILHSLLFFTLAGCLISGSFSCCKEKDILSRQERAWLDKNRETITLAPEPDYPPVNFIDKMGQFRGIAADYIALIEKRLNIKFKIAYYKSFNDMLKAAREKKIDVATVVVKTPERSKYLLFTEPIIISPNVIITRKSLKGPLSMKDLSRYRVVTTRGYAVNEYIARHYPSLKLIHVNNDVEGLTMVSEGRADAVVTELPSASYHIKMKGLENLRVAGTTGSQYRLSIASRIDNPLLNSILQKGLSLITEEEKKTIQRKWISMGNIASADEGPRRKLIAAVILTLLLLSIILIILFKFRAGKNEQQPKNRVGRNWLPGILVVMVTLAILAAAAIVIFYLVFSPRSKHKLTEVEKQWLWENREQIIFASDISYPPVDFIDEKGVHRGITADYLHLMEKQLNFKFKRLYFNSWKELLDKAKEGKIHLVASIQNSPERRKYLSFTEPYVEVPNTILTSTRIRRNLTLEDCSGMSAAVVEGYTIIDYIKKQNPLINLVEVKDTETGLRMLSFGQVDILITDYAVSSFFIEKLGITNLRSAGPIDYTYRLCFATQKDMPLFNSIIKKTLLQVSPKEKKDIQQKWMHFAHHSFSLDRTALIPFALGAGVLVLLILLVLVWNRLLHSQVRQKTEEIQKTLDELENTKSLLESIIQQSPIPMAAVSLPEQVISVINPACREVLGISNKETIIGRDAKPFGQSWQFFLPDDSIVPVRELPMMRACKGMRTDKTEMYVKRQDGTVRWVESGGVPIYNSRKELIAGLVIFPDITEMKTALERLKASISEKEILIKEIHHRVKNNLQIISSLLNLQSMNIEDQEVRDIFMQSKNRIHTMAMVHEKLYRSDNYAEIDFREYLVSLVDELIASQSDYSTRITKEIRAEKILLTVDNAIPCALIVNELVTNALKHAFTGIDEGKLTITLQQSSEGDITLEVADNGVGMTEDFNYEETDTLGLNIIKALALQLRGEMTYSSENGSRFTLVFKPH